MILDLLIDSYRPRTLAAAEKEFATRLEVRGEAAPLLGWWQTDVGPLNQAVQLWGYESTEARESVLSRNTGAASWPPEPGEGLIERVSTLFTAAPFCPALAPRAHGIYELRLYTYAPGDIEMVIERWSAELPRRVSLAPLVAAGRSGVQNGEEQWLHLWAFRDAGERQRVRAHAVEQGIWPPKGMPSPLGMRNLLLLPAPFSPLR